MALLKQQQQQQQQQQQAARVNSPTVPINIAAQQQQQAAASQLMKRPMTMHEDPAYTASQLFSQQPAPSGDPHEHSTNAPSQQTANTDNMDTN